MLNLRKDQNKKLLRVQGSPSLEGAPCRAGVSPVSLSLDITKHRQSEPYKAFLGQQSPPHSVF